MSKPVPTFATIREQLESALGFLDDAESARWHRGRVASLDDAIEVTNDAYQSLMSLFDAETSEEDSDE